MCKGLPTFRAGGIASSFIDYGVRADQSGGGGSGGHKKTALTPTFFSHDHFSSSLADTEGADVRLLMRRQCCPCTCGAWSMLKVECPTLLLVLPVLLVPLLLLLYYCCYCNCAREVCSLGFAVVRYVPCLFELSSRKKNSCWVRTRTPGTVHVLFWWHGKHGALL